MNLRRDRLVGVTIGSVNLSSLGPFGPRRGIVRCLVTSHGGGGLISVAYANFTRRATDRDPTPNNNSVSTCVNSLSTTLNAVITGLSDRGPN